MIKRVESKTDFIKIEHKILDFWDANSIFEKRRKLNENNKHWSFIDGPITANKPMGVHHAWGRTLKDIFNRYKAMNGYELRYQQGFDCQGLWVEVEVEKELGFKSKKDVEKFGIEKFVTAIKLSSLIAFNAIFISSTQFIVSAITKSTPASLAHLTCSSYIF